MVSLLSKSKGGDEKTRQRILVTGASRGIGKAIAETLAQEDPARHIVLHCVHSTDAVEEACADIQAAGGSASWLQFDIGDREQCKQVLEQELSSNGAFYGVVLNAGITNDGIFPALSEEAWDGVLRTNLDGFYNVLSPLVMPMIRRRKSGRIISITSAAGDMGNPGQTNYAAAKAGIVGASKSLALELASRKITVNCVAPGFIETDMTADLPLEEMLAAVPLRRAGQSTEVASLVRYLLSDEAAYITRQVIAVNGGLY